MKLFLVFVLLCTGCSAQKASKTVKQSPTFNKAATAAYDAVDLVPYSLDRIPDAEWQPRYLEAQKALKTAARARLNDADRSAYDVLDAWLFFKEMSRDERDMRVQHEKDFPGMLQCGVESHSMFGTEPLTEQGKKTAAEKTCLKLRDGRVAEMEAATKGNRP